MAKTNVKSTKKTVKKAPASTPTAEPKSDSESLEVAESNDSSEMVEGLREEADAELQEAFDESQVSDQDNSIAIVIPYKEESAAGTELLYAIRAWEKFFPKGKIVIIGDKPSSLNDNIVHIPHTPISDNPQVDVAQKLMMAIESDLVSDFFIVSNDDIYPVSPLSLTQIDLLVSGGPFVPRGNAGGVFRENSERTIEALKEAQIKTPMDYSTHTPVTYWKEELKEILLKYGCLENGFLISTLYNNIVWQGSRPVVVDNGANPGHAGTRSYVGSAFKKVNPDNMRDAFENRIFINNDDRGWASVLPFLQKLFPEKSSFEK
ncbi:MAG: hypothetical protein RIC03_12505 [Cyclobacteriaceae bacterium]